jgi:AcrR family transcriptional regulator
MPSKTSAEPRSRRARNSLTVDAILDAAEHVAAAGFEALTVRAVAVALEAAPMSLYRYFATKDELVDALLNIVLGGSPLRPKLRAGRTTWRRLRGTTASCSGTTRGPSPR